MLERTSMTRESNTYTTAAAPAPRDPNPSIRDAHGRSRRNMLEKMCVMVPEEFNCKSSNEMKVTAHYVNLSCTQPYNDLEFNQLKNHPSRLGSYLRVRPALTVV